MVVIFRGITGSGKSTMASVLLGKSTSQKVWDEHAQNISRDTAWAQYLLKLRQDTQGKPAWGFSTDNFFTSPDGTYNFDPKYLSEAHNKCFRDFISEVSKSQNGLYVVDNTNTSIAEVAPYIFAAQAFNHDLRIITLISSPAECAKRGVHGAPDKSVMRQHLSLEQSLRDWPQWWPQEIFFT